MKDGATFDVFDLLANRGYRWQGSRNYVELRPYEVPAHVFQVTRQVVKWLFKQVHQDVHEENDLKQAGSTADPLWFKDAVIYELHARAFMDSNNDGTLATSQA